MTLHRTSKALCAFALLAALFCYSFDVECLLESRDCHKSQDQEISRLCVEPALTSNGYQPGAVLIVAILPPPPVVIAPLASQLVTQEAVFAEYREPYTRERSVPLGLRAPPTAIG